MAARHDRRRASGTGCSAATRPPTSTAQIKEPFIQKYLKSLAIHLLLMPTTHVVALIVAFIYVRLHPELTWQQASLATGVIFGLFQIIPISPGSIARGIYTSSLILREKNFKDYSIAFWLSFFKYIGYLAFPIQMAYRYPDLARFMAGHWATGAVHIVPIFGEKGAWLEHFVFDIFYNFPLTDPAPDEAAPGSAFREKAALRARAPHRPGGDRPARAFMDFVYFKIDGNGARLEERLVVGALGPALRLGPHQPGRRRSCDWARGSFWERVSGGMIGLFYAAGEYVSSAALHGGSARPRRRSARSRSNPSGTSSCSRSSPSSAPSSPRRAESDNPARASPNLARNRHPPRHGKNHLACFSERPRITMV